MKIPDSLDELLTPKLGKPITAIIKRGEKTKTVKYTPEKIVDAVRKASVASGINYNEEHLKNFVVRVGEKLQSVTQENGFFKYSEKKTPRVEDVEEAVFETFDDLNAEILSKSISDEWSSVEYNKILPKMREMVKGVDSTGAFYRRYKEGRELVREKLINLPFAVDFDSTDKQLGIHALDNGTASKFNSDVMELLIVENTSVSYEDARKAVKRLEEILANRKTSRLVEKEELLSIVDSSLMELGYAPKDLLGGRRVNISLDDIEQIIYSRSVENSNIQANNPEAVNLSIAELALKEYALREIFDEDVAEAHKNGKIHLHDLGYPDRVYCSAHSVEFIKKYGLDKTVANLDSKSHPAGDDPKVLNNHIHTFLAAIQSSYAGALGFPMLNTLYGPSLLKEIKVVEGKEILRNSGGKIEKEIPRRMKRENLEEKLEEEKERVKRMEGGFIDTIEDEEGVFVPLPLFEFKETNSYKMLKEYSKKELKEVAQNLIFGASQSAFSRGGQTLFIDFNIDLSTPNYVKNIPALFSKATYIKTKQNKRGEWEIVERNKQEPLRNKDEDVIQPEDGTVYMTYGHELVKKASQDFAEALLEIFKEGDKYGVPFNFPKCDVHVGEETFNDPAQERLLQKACEVVEHNDSVYFMFDRGDGMNVAQCCRLRERITDPYMLKHPEKMRFCGFQNVSINLPQTGYNAKGENLEEKLESTLGEIDKSMIYALKAHTNKRRYIQNLLDTEGSPLRDMGANSDDGEPYIDLNKASYIIGIIGLNELVQHLTGKELHEDAEAYKLGLKIISHMHSMKNQMSEKYKMKFIIEETPGESANRRFAKLDLIRYPEETKPIIKGNIEEDEVYYTNSAHLRPDAKVSGLDRAILQAKTNPMIEAGAITHLFTGEKKNKANATYDFVKSIYYNTQSSQVVFSGEHTSCCACGNHTRGLVDKCPECGNEDSSQISQKTRIVGYFSDPRSWNKSKKGELKDRQKAMEHYVGEASSLHDLEAELYKSIIEEGKIRVGILGTPECPQCTRAQEIAERQIKKLPKEMAENIELVKYDLRNEDDRVIAAIYNAPIDTYPTIVVHKGDKVERFSSEYNGKTRTINSPIFKTMLEKVVDYAPVTN
ncbi:MAG: anaerobic ribonucleoside-triphosphate reductase [Candidatus Diapherotrites archaeon]